jgi:NAD(P)-dependent dehydrogenase (short-subunit alcohol dehydrogenase family)
MGNVHAQEVGGSMEVAKKGRTVVITGSNSGIGKAAARRFAAEGDHVVMACRNVEAAETARAEILAGLDGASAEIMPLDVSSFASVRQFAVEFKGRHPRLDVLIHNAGYFNHGLRTYQFSPDGLERTFATNVFGPVLLTELLVEQLAAAPDARVLLAGSTIVKSFFDPRRKIEFDNLRGEHATSRPYAVYDKYRESKMGVVLVTRRLAQELAHRGVKVNCIMIPGVRVERHVLRKFTGRFRVIGTLTQYLNPFLRPPSRLARTYYHICSDADLKDVTGEHFDHHREVLPVLPPDQELNPFQLMRELLSSPTLTPAYAGAPENVDRMWDVVREAIE